MGMDPVTLGALITAGGKVGSSMFAPEGQMLSSFEDGGAVDPHTTLADARNKLMSVFNAVEERAHTPVDMSHAYVQDLPSFAGGSLPMPIGTTGSWGKGMTTGVGAGGGTGGTSAPLAGAPGLPSSSTPGTPSPEPEPMPLYMGRAPSSGSLLNGLSLAMDGGSGGSSGPLRRSPTGSMASTSTPASVDGGASKPNSQAIGAVSLLLKLAQAGKQNGSGMGGGLDFTLSGAGI